MSLLGSFADKINLYLLEYFQTLVLPLQVRRLRRSVCKRRTKYHYDFRLYFGSPFSSMSRRNNGGGAGLSPLRGNRRPLPLSPERLALRQRLPAGSVYLWAANFDGTDDFEDGTSPSNVIVGWIVLLVRC